MRVRSLAKKLFWAGLAFALASNAVSAQSGLDDILSALDARAAELERAQAILDDPDANRRIAAMKLLLKSDDEQFRHLAREFGLFSADPALRQAALVEILNAGGGFRLETDAPAEGSTDIHLAITRLSGSLDGTGKGSVPFVLKPGFDNAESCWRNTRNNNCTLLLAGATVHLHSWGAGSTNIAGAFRLDASGNLEGHVLVNGNGRPVAARIALID